MTDLISRADAIELFEKYKPRMAVSVYEYGQALKALPSAEYSKPLQTTLNGDLVSRTDAIEAVHKYFVEALDHEPYEIDEDGDDVFTDMKSVNALLHHNKYVSKALKALPSADAGQGWIPCSERLPKRDELVLVTYKTTDRIHLCRYLDDGSENPWWSYIDDCCAWNNVVLAWMPLPKPYREDGE